MKVGEFYNDPLKPKEIKIKGHFPGDPDDWCEISWLRLFPKCLRVRIEFSNGNYYTGLVAGFPPKSQEG